jgi:hypothetical protein
MSDADLTEARRQLFLASSALLQPVSNQERIALVDARLRIADLLMEIHAEDPSSVDEEAAEDLSARPSPSEDSQRVSEPIIPGVDNGIKCRTAWPHVGHWIWCSGIPNPKFPNVVEPAGPEA